ncbi:uncharacterized protein LOC126897731 isoform X2 [Daktulosphaira vitifoliae]|uniref:uncharacterized protein LOC126897731 isoform X2 n=1 Tax=Daktulosphaira vitifoliae TaxID=58002 RepID=UPI0021AA5E63|nr:uncharacterized protein LOC126897731 isoform X2 [Daktulosphaira vitifoliae]
MTTKKNDTTDLNYDMNYNLFLLKTSMQNLKSPQDKYNVNLWLQKLLASNKTTAEMRLRNDFMYHLVTAVQDGELRPPFTHYPPSQPLSDLAYLLTGGAPDLSEKDSKKGSGAWECELSSEETDKPMLYRQSPDGGAFLAAQPIPKCGAFCYLAVVSKPPKKEDDPKL